MERSPEKEASGIFMRFTGALPFRRLSVGTKTWISLSLLFWIPFSILIVLMFLFLRSSREEEQIERLRHDLRTAKIFEREAITGIRVRFELDAPKLAYAFRDRNAVLLHRYLSDPASGNTGADFLLAVDPARRILAASNKEGLAGQDLRSVPSIADALLRAEEKDSTELIENAFLYRAGLSLPRETGDRSMLRLFICPVREGDRVVGALVAGFVVTGATVIPNRVFQDYDAEIAVFVGETPGGALLHSASSLPRTVWTTGQALPDSLKETIYLNRPFAGDLNLSGLRYVAVAEPVLDGRGAVIGALVAAHTAPFFEETTVRRVLLALLAGAILGLIPAAFITYFIHRDITGSIGAMTGAMQRFSTGDNLVRLELRTGDEFEEMGSGFNHMVEDIVLREDRLRKHYEVAHLLMGSLQLEELLQRVLRIAIDVTRSLLGVIYLYREEEDVLVPEATWGISDPVQPLKPGAGLPGRAALERKSILIDLTSPTAAESWNDLPRPDTGSGTISLKAHAFIPFCYQDRLLGVLTLGSHRAYEAEDRRLFDYLANQIAIALDNSLLHSQVQELSVTDHLTGLYNRRYLGERIDVEWARTIRHGRPLSLVICDVDDFKKINDRWGHARGDEVLVAVSSVLKKAARKEDLVSRFGGEEFLVVLPDTGLEGAVQFAERRREEIAALPFPWKGGSVTMSFGVASHPEIPVESCEGLFRIADQALYRAKVRGKNRVESQPLEA